MATETRWLSRWWRLPVLVILILATIGTWEIVKQIARPGGYAHADFADHLTCYNVKSANADDRIDPNAKVLLRDQFFPTGVEAEVRELRLLCTGAVKTKL